MSKLGELIREGLLQELIGWERVIDVRAAQAREAIKKMANAAYLELGFTQAWINRSRGQKRRWAKVK